MAEPTIPYIDAVSNVVVGGNIAVADDAAMQAGDLRIVIFSISTETITTPAGWDLISPTPIVFQTTRRIYVFKRTHPGAGETTHNFAISNAANYSRTQLGIRGADPTTPINIAPAVGSGSSGTSLTAPTATPTVDEALILRTFHMLLNSSSLTMTDPAGTTRLDYQAGTGSAGHGVLCTKDTTPPAANVSAGTKVATASSSGVWGAMTMVIAPAVAAEVQKLEIIRYRRSRPMFRR